MTARSSLRKALKDLDQCSPNGRDFVLNRPGEFNIAIKEHQARYKAVNAVFIELGDLAVAIDIQGRE